MKDPKPDREPLAVDISLSDDTLLVVLASGREVAAPLSWFPRLQKATPEQRQNGQLVGGGSSIYWEAVGENISVSDLLAKRGSLTKTLVCFDSGMDAHHTEHSKIYHLIRNFLDKKRKEVESRGDVAALTTFCAMEKKIKRLSVSLLEGEINLWFFLNKLDENSLGLLDLASLKTGTKNPDRTMYAGFEKYWHVCDEQAPKYGRATEAYVSATLQHAVGISDRIARMTVNLCKLSNGMIWAKAAGFTSYRTAKLYLQQEFGRNTTELEDLNEWRNKGVHEVFLHAHVRGEPKEVFFTIARALDEISEDNSFALATLNTWMCSLMGFLKWWTEESRKQLP